MWDNFLLASGEHPGPSSLSPRRHICKHTGAAGGVSLHAAFRAETHLNGFLPLFSKEGRSLTCEPAERSEEDAGDMLIVRFI